MTVYEFNQICLTFIVIYTKCGDKDISIFTQHGPDGDIPELFENCEIRELWREDNLIAVLI